MTESLDDLAAFLMHRTADEGMPEEQRLAIFVLVGAYQEQDDPTTVAAAMRNEADSFRRTRRLPRGMGSSRRGSKASPSSD